MSKPSNADGGYGVAFWLGGGEAAAECEAPPAELSAATAELLAAKASADEAAAVKTVRLGWPDHKRGSDAARKPAADDCGLGRLQSAPQVPKLKP